MPTLAQSLKALPSRQDRLRALRDGQAVSPLNPAEEIARKLPEQSKVAQVEAQAGSVAPLKLRAASPMIKRVMKMLTDTVDGNGKKIEGTPFTEEGVGRLMAMMTERVQTQSSNGGKMAEKMLAYLSAAGDEPAIHGASLEKIQTIARLAEPQMRQNGLI